MHRIVTHKIIILNLTVAILVAFLRATASNARYCWGAY